MSESGEIPADADLRLFATELYRRFAADLRQGYRTKDKEFAVSLLGKGLGLPTELRPPYATPMEPGMSESGEIPADVMRTAEALFGETAASRRESVYEVARAILAERERIAKALEDEADVVPCEEDAVVVRSCARLVRADFSYDIADQLAEAAISHRRR